MATRFKSNEATAVESQGALLHYVSMTQELAKGMMI